MKRVVLALTVFLVPGMVEAQSFQIPQWTNLRDCQQAFSEAMLVIQSANSDAQRFKDGWGTCLAINEGVLNQRDLALKEIARLKAQIRKLKKQGRGR